MGQLERRQREQEALRNRILEAARELFVESGYDAVTMRGLAEKIDYSPTTIYLHFKDKDALIRELCSEDFLALAQCFTALATRPDPLARIRAIGLAFLDFGLKHPNHYRMMFMTPHAPVPPEARRIEQGSLQEDAWAILVGAVSEAQEQGLLNREPGDPAWLAQQFFSGIHGVLALHLAKGNDPWIPWAPIRKAGKRMLDALLRGAAATDAASAEAEAPRKRTRRARSGDKAK